MAVTVQIKMRNSDSYLAQFNSTIEEAERFLLGQKFIKLQYNGAVVYLASEDVTSIAIQKLQEETDSVQESFEEVLDKQ